MSNFNDFMTMKLIEIRRMENGYVDNKFQDYMFEQLNMNKNLNVRTRVDLISKIEVLANYLGVSKAELVTEMLESSVIQAMDMIEKEGWLDNFLTTHFKHLETEYGIVAKERDEKGHPVTFDIPAIEK